MNPVDPVTAVAYLDMLLTESQSNLRDTIQICRNLLAENAQLMAWQVEAIDTLKRWDRCSELVPSSRKPVGARVSDCVFAYIDHLQEEIAAARAEIRTLIAANHSLADAAGV